MSNNDDYFNVDRFNQLLAKLEASKGRQVRQKAVEGRRDIFAQGLAGMMGNFWSLDFAFEPWQTPYQVGRPMLMIGLI